MCRSEDLALYLYIVVNAFKSTAFIYYLCPTKKTYHAPYHGICATSHQSTSSPLSLPLRLSRELRTKRERLGLLPAGVGALLFLSLLG